MNAIAMGRLWLAAGLLAWADAGRAQPAATPPAPQAPQAGQETAERAKAAGLGVGAAAARWEQGVRFNVDGLALDEVTTWIWNNRDITKAVKAALEDGSAAAAATLTGFKLDWRYPPEELGMGREGVLGVKAKSLENAVLIAPPSAPCPGSAAFGEATSPPLRADTSCLYENGSCGQPGGRPTGVDYAGSGSVLAVAAGTVVRLELANIHDQGRGTHILVRHLLPEAGCPTVYSHYFHLESAALGIAMNMPVAKGQVLGTIGGSGYGKPNYYSQHLHLEIKTDPGDGSPLAAKADEQGRLDPADYLGKTFATPLYKQVSKNADHGCAIRSDGSLACWGANDYGQANPPAGNYKQVSAGGKHNCALRSDYALACWGWNGYEQSAPPPGNYTQVSAGGRHSCAVKANGGLACWGNNWWGQATAPEGNFKQVGAGAYHSCAVRDDDTLACWGNDTKGQAEAPAGAFKQVGAGAFHTCAIKADGALACWGENGQGQASPPAGSFKQLDTNDDYNCATRVDGFSMCWGQEPKLDH